jgi:AraC family transcriptional regulator
MLRNSLSANAASSALFDDGSLQPLERSRPPSLARPHPHRRNPKRTDRDMASSRSDGQDQPRLEISPAGVAKRHLVAWGGIVAETIQLPSQGRIELRFSDSRHLLVAHEHGVRRDGETFIQGLPRSTRRDLTHRLTFVPAGHMYHDWHEPRIPGRLVCFYFDPAEPQLKSALDACGADVAPRLFVEDPMLWSTVSKLRKLVESVTPENRPYLEALGAVLVHELARSHSGEHARAQARGGLAAWQQRTVTAYIDEHLAEHISLAALAQLVRLSPYHFCRAFKQSFGIPPHRYHISRRIERAKLLLQERPLSVTDIGLTLGFSETSSFTAAFRKATGLTPSSYHRSLG